MKLEVNPVIGYIVIGGVLILAFLLFRGCQQSRKLETANKSLTIINDSTIAVIKASKTEGDSTKKAFQDTVIFLTGQNALVSEQKLKIEDDLRKSNKENRALIARHKLAEYADTSMVSAPCEFVADCESCFDKLETTTNLNDRYKANINTLQNNWDKQNQTYQKRFKELDAEKSGFYNKISALAKLQQEAVDKLKPHGRLYLSWGILWEGWPAYAGGGLLYQTKHNMIYGAKCYYGSKGMLIETTMNFPLSIKF